MSYSRTSTPAENDDGGRAGGVVGAGDGGGGSCGNGGVIAAAVMMVWRFWGAPTNFTTRFPPSRLEWLFALCNWTRLMSFYFRNMFSFYDHLCLFCACFVCVFPLIVVACRCGCVYTCARGVLWFLIERDKPRE